MLTCVYDGGRNVIKIEDKQRNRRVICAYAFFPMCKRNVMWYDNLWISNWNTVYMNGTIACKVVISDAKCSLSLCVCVCCQRVQQFEFIADFCNDMSVLCAYCWILMHCCRRHSPNKKKRKKQNKTQHTPNSIWFHQVKEEYK